MSWKSSKQGRSTQDEKVTLPARRAKASQRQLNLRVLHLLMKMKILIRRKENKKKKMLQVMGRKVIMTKKMVAKFPNQKRKARRRKVKLRQLSKRK